MSRQLNPFRYSRFENIKPDVFNINYLKLLIDIAQFCHPAESKKSVRMLLRSLYWRRQTFIWFNYIASDSLLSRLVWLETNFPEKLHRQILRTDYSIDQRLSILMGHYQRIRKLISEELLVKALLDGGLELAVIDLPGQQYRLQLVYGAYPAKEGELSIVMLDSEQTVLVRLSFSVLPVGESHLLYIAGIQGAAGENSREKVGSASKACFGLAPRRIAIEVLLAIAQHTAAKQILGVSDKHHISSKKLTKHFSYDDYWSDFEASLNADGDYILPLVPKHKDYADTPRKRRAKYRRQQELLAAVSQATLAALQ